MGSNAPSDDDNFEFNWIKKRQEVGIPDMREFNDETSTEKFYRKAKENPLVPVGVLLTTACLSLGLMSMRRGDKRMSQLMMRGRVLAQGFTIAALITGVCLKTSSNFDSEDE